MEYTFPFNTCETPNKNGIAQPYSALFNAINCLVIVYFFSKNENKICIFIIDFYFMF